MEARGRALSAPVAVVMGVSGTGKTTLATALADRLGCPFCEGDALHSAAEVAKMSSGHALTDADRAPWLRRVAEQIDEWLAAGVGGVITCSALKRSYRDVLRRPAVMFVLIDVPRSELERRLRERQGHFMPASLLDSQLATLESPGDDERAVVLDGAQPFDEQLDEVAILLER